MEPIVIPQEKLEPIKQIETQLFNLRREFQLLELQKKILIQDLLIDYSLPREANIHPDGSVEIPNKENV